MDDRPWTLALPDVRPADLDAKIINRENIARCCVACNASKGTKDLAVWLESNYCKKRGITKNTVAEVVRKALEQFPVENRGLSD